MPPAPTSTLVQYNHESPKSPQYESILLTPPIYAGPRKISSSSTDSSSASEHDQKNSETKNLDLIIDLAPRIPLLDNEMVDDSLTSMPLSRPKKLTWKFQPRRRNMYINLHENDYRRNSHGIVKSVESKPQIPSVENTRLDLLIPMQVPIYFVYVQKE